MPNEHRADPTPPPHHGQGRGGSKKESSSLRVSPALHPPERHKIEKNKKNGFGPFSYKFFVPIRVGLMRQILTGNRK